jgi:hypothetical protein
VVADFESGLGTRAAAIEPNLPAAQDPIDVALGHPLQNLEEVVVDALAGTIVPDGVPADGILA